ncbi:MAG TPA: NF038122 family metalloprotease [Humisphaera sp.]
MATVVSARAGAVVSEALEARRLFASIAGTVFNDLNGDGVRQAAENALANRQVFVDLNGDGQRQSAEPAAVTDARGAYRFANLKAGTYTVRQVLAGGAEQTAPGGPGTTASTLRTAGAAGGTRVEVIAGPNLLKNAAALAAARAAAAVWERMFTDDVQVRVDLDLLSMGPGGVLGATSSTTVDLPYDQVRDAIVASAARDEAFSRSLPTRATLKARLPQNTSGEPFVFNGTMTVNRANALALGYAPSEVEGPASEFRPSVVADGSILINRDEAWDFTPADGIAKGREDFYATVLHELGHVLGFESGVDTLDARLEDPYADLPFKPTPLDLYRLKPGAGGSGFGTAVRQWVTGRDQPAQVFYDGGVYDPTGVAKVPGLRRGDIPFSTGSVSGDGQQASHWKDDAVTTRFVGIMDPTLDRSFTAPAATDVRALGLLGWDVRQPLPGLTVTVGAATAATGRNFGTRAGDDDDQLSEAKVVLPGQTLTGLSVGWATDADLYAIHGKKGEWFTIDVDGSGSFDSYLRVLTADGVQLAANDNAAAPGETLGKSSYLKFTLPRDGTFFVGVSGKGNAAYEVVNGTGDAAGSTGAYTLTVRNATVDDDCTRAGATVLKVGQTVGGAIATATDVDLYKITVVAGQRIGFDVDRPGANGLDSFLRLFDANGTEIEANDDSPARGEDWTYESYIEHRFATGGTYYVGVSSTGNDAYNVSTGTGSRDGTTTGSYTLTAKLV